MVKEDGIYEWEIGSFPLFSLSNSPSSFKFPLHSSLSIILIISHALDLRRDILVSEPTVPDDISATVVEVNCVG